MNPIEYVYSDALQCSWDPASFLMFSAEVEPLVYYSHLFPALAVAVLAFVVLLRTSGRLTSKLFFTVAMFFVIYSIFDLILWATEKPSIIMTLWSLLTYIEPLIYASTIYLVLVFVRRKDIFIYEKVVGAILLFPVFLLGATDLNLSGFDYTNCGRLAVEGPLILYVYFIELIFVLWAIIASVISIKNESSLEHKKSSWLLLLGSILFLLSFSSGNIFGTLFQGYMGEEAWVIGQYGFFGMPLFLGLILYLMVRYELFSARIIYAEAILLGTFIALLSLLLIPNIQTARPVIGITLLLFAVLGFFLLNGIKNDLKQKQENKKLAENLEKVNSRLRLLDKQKSEFVSIASHQLRSPLTAIRGYVSLIEEGNFGPVPEQMKDALHRVSESSKFMAVSIDDFLNVSRIESGNMKYELKDINLREQAEHIVEDLRTDAIKRGLLLMFKTDLSSKGIVNADFGKTQQILHNLINNALKYTKQGTVTVFVHDNPAKKIINVEFIDTGIGMSEVTLEKIFGKFARAKVASSANIMGTGLGLFVARSMARAMEGDVTAHSEGEGKGSKFVLTLPLVM